MELIERAGNSTDTLELIRVIDELYNRLMDPDFESMHGTLEQVLAVTVEELMEYNWRDFLTEEIMPDLLKRYAGKNRMLYCQPEIWRYVPVRIRW